MRPGVSAMSANSHHSVQWTTYAPSPRPPNLEVSPEAEELINSTKLLASELRALASANQKLEKIKGNEELTNRIDEILLEIEEQSEKIFTVVGAASVQRDLKTLQTAMLEVKEFFETVSKASMFASKHKLRLKMQNAYQSLRARCTQLMTGVSLELLTQKPVEEKPVKVSSELYRLGLNHYYGIGGKSKNYTLAFEKFCEASEYGEVDGMVMVAQCYQEGHGVEPSVPMALHWLERAAVTGSAPHAKTAIATIVISKLKAINPNIVREHFAGESGAAHDRLSVGNASVASYQDDSPHRGLHLQADQRAESELRIEVEEESRDIQFAIKLLLEAASEGHAQAKTVLGTMFEDAGDATQACKWYSLASNSGCSKATFLLAEMFFHAPAAGPGSSAGTGSATGQLAHRQKAFSLYTMAAKNGHNEAHYGLGLCYEIGLGCEVSIAQAIQHYTIAAKAGSGHAMYNLGYVLVRSALEAQDAQDSLPIDSEAARTAVTERMVANLTQGVMWLRGAMECEVTDAAFQLGRLYDQGVGLPCDSHAALQCYLRAAERGHTAAAFLAAHLLYARGEPTQAAHYYKLAADAGHVEACNCFALLLEEGVLPVSRGRDGELSALLTAGDDLDAQLGSVLLACRYYHQAVEGHYTPAVYNLLLLLYTYNVQSFVTRQGDVIHTNALLPVLHRLGEEQGDKEVFDAVLQAMQTSSSNAAAALPQGNRASTGRPPLFHHSFPLPLTAASRTGPSQTIAATAEYKDSGAVGDLVLHQGGAGHRAMSSRGDALGTSNLSDLWQVSVLNSSARSSTAQQHRLPAGASSANASFSSTSLAVNAASSSPAATSNAAAASPVTRHLVRSGEVYMTNGSIVPPNYVPRAVIQTMPLSVADKKPSSKGSSPPADLNHRPLPPTPASAAPAQTPAPGPGPAPERLKARSTSAPPKPPRPHSIDFSSTSPQPATASAQEEKKRYSLWDKLYKSKSSPAAAVGAATIAASQDAGPGTPPALH